MREFVAELRIAVVTTIVLVVLLCGVYPAVVRALAWAFFPETSGGSLVERQGKVLGSKLLGQEFAGAKYFHGRPSAAGAGYDGTSSGGSNLGPLSRDLIDAVGRRAANYRSENNLAAGAAVPVDAVTASEAVSTRTSAYRTPSFRCRGSRRQGD